MDKFNYILLLVAALLGLSACSTTMVPFKSQRVQPGVESAVNESLENLPPPKEKVVAAVYRFSDQTGQYKPAEQVASWSTAVTQGATSILIKAMSNSGWFIPIERESLSNLLNERKIINSTRTQNNDNSSLPPLLFAGILLEGGIVGYDTNIITGGGGARYLGLDVSGQFRKDQVTIYLRAVSTQTGRILKTVHTTKSIISQQLSGGIFRFIDENRLLEAEAGYTFNEPPVMAVTEAIDEALKTLVVEGVDEGLWDPQSQEQFSSYKQKFIDAKVQENRKNVDYFGFNRNKRLRKGFYGAADFIYGSHMGNLPDPKTMAGGSLKLEYFLSPSISLAANGQRSKIGVANMFSQYYIAFDAGIRTYLTPDLPFSPYAGFGLGALSYDFSPVYYHSPNLSSGWIQNDIYPTANAQAGLDYRFSENIGFRMGIDYRYLLNGGQEGLDGVQAGKINDQQWNLYTGFSISPNIFKSLFN
ncbi:MAG: CsgG/HfaB family protein [Balneolaceae bacterium]|nr:CsgG/HfaB family protein [Balneolaceae bacterium]